MRPPRAPCQPTTTVSAATRTAGAVTSVTNRAPQARPGRRDLARNRVSAGRPGPFSAPSPVAPCPFPSRGCLPVRFTFHDPGAFHGPGAGTGSTVGPRSERPGRPGPRSERPDDRVDGGLVVGAVLMAARRWSKVRCWWRALCRLTGPAPGSSRTASPGFGRRRRLGHRRVGRRRRRWRRARRRGRRGRGGLGRAVDGVGPPNRPARPGQVAGPGPEARASGQDGPADGTTTTPGPTDGTTAGWPIVGNGTITGPTDGAGMNGVRPSGSAVLPTVAEPALMAARIGIEAVPASRATVDRYPGRGPRGRVRGARRRPWRQPRPRGAGRAAERSDPHLAGHAHSSVCLDHGHGTWGPANKRT